MRVLLPLAFPFLTALVSCSAAPQTPLADRTDVVEQAFTSPAAVLLDFEFDGVITSTTSDQAALRDQIASQLMYTVGHLNGDNSVGRLERLVLSGIVVSGAPGGYSATYHARLPVAWGRMAAQPSTYTFRLPTVGADDALDTWVASHNTTCVLAAGRGSDRWSMWYYYRPNQAGCALSPADSVTFTATVTRSPENATGKYPEYDKVWEDHQLNVVAMFSRDVSNATSNADAGIREYNTFVASLRRYARSVQPNPALITESPGISNTPGAGTRQVSIRATLPANPGEPTRQLNVNVMLVGYRLYQDGSTFDSWYNALTPTADMILYNGHAGLGENVHTLMTKGDFVPGKYFIWLVNGCDTFAYVDNTLSARIEAVNGGAPATQFMDTITNAMPGYFSTLPATSMSLIHGMMTIFAPKSYLELLTSIDRVQVALVTGEEDNVWQPGTPVIPGVTPGPPPTQGAGDGGVIVADGGRSDGGSPRDAGPAPGATPPGASGSGSGEPEAGCACETAPGRPVSGGSLATLWLVVGLGAVAGRRRR